MSWILILCTKGALGMCGVLNEYQYRDEDSCYKALNTLYDSQGRSSVHYAVCVERKPTTDK